MRDEPVGPEDQGGDPACWLDQVCETCGRVRERGLCPACDARGTGPDRPGPA